MVARVLDIVVVFGFRTRAAGAQKVMMAMVRKAVRPPMIGQGSCGGSQSAVIGDGFYHEVLTGITDVTQVDGS